jgi:hypothetical protein
MIKHIAATITLFALATMLPPPADAQSAAQTRAVTGTFGNTSNTTSNYRFPDSDRTTNQRVGRQGFASPQLRMTGLGGLATIHGPTGRNGLPVTSLDSFVLNAGGHAEHIYGDEGADGLPPYFEFTKAHRINTGITGDRDEGLTTNHGSYMPDAWGGDEFVDGPEWSQSGHNGGNAGHWSQGVYTGASPFTPAFNNQPMIDQNGNINNVAFPVGSVGQYRTDQGPTTPPTGDSPF